MGNPAAEYEVIGLRASHRIVRKKRKGAPQEQWMVGWRILDIRKALEVGGFSSRKFWTGHERGSTYFPSEDAAIMAAIHMLD